MATVKAKAKEDKEKWQQQIENTRRNISNCNMLRQEQPVALVLEEAREANKPASGSKKAGFTQRSPAHVYLLTLDQPPIK